MLLLLPAPVKSCLAPSLNCCREPVRGVPSSVVLALYLALMRLIRRFPLLTVTVNVPWEALPAASRARQETVDVPTANCVPESGLQATDTAPETASAALAANVTVALSVMSPLALTAPGNVRTGGVVSWTVTEKAAEPTFPAASVAEQVTRLSPIGKLAPETTGVGRPRPVVMR